MHNPVALSLSQRLFQESMKITNDGTFDAFPVFSNDGKHLVFSSNRNNGGTRDTNLFVAEWIWELID
jgi:Tol biopolymer transport system component